MKINKSNFSYLYSLKNMSIFMALLVIGHSVEDWILYNTVVLNYNVQETEQYFF